MNRRAFAAGLGTSGAAATSLFSRSAKAASPPRVVVIGGGPGGATVAKNLSMYKPEVSTTLVEANPVYTTCFFSNLYMAGLRELDQLRHDYRTLANYYRIDVKIDRAVEIDPINGRVVLAGGERLDYDRLVLAPGIRVLLDADEGGIEGYDLEATQAMPHAWTGADQLRSLKQHASFLHRGRNPDAGLFVITVPDTPYRCPPGPYERASLFAWRYKRLNPKVKILILDAKTEFPKQALFEEAWRTLYPGTVEWVPGDFGGAVARVDPASMEIVTTDGETIKADVANVIPPQRAGELAELAGCTDASGWCPVDPVTFESSLVPGVHVVGDACIAGDMPKSAFAATSQGKACAMAVRAALTDAPAFDPHLFNTCYSALALGDAVKIGAAYAPVDGRITSQTSFVSEPGDSAETRAGTYAEAEAWYRAIVRDVWG